jgi:hypothetical protein
MKEDIFVFAIAYNCGLILNKCLESFHKYHDCKVHIFGTYKDFKQLTKHKNNEYIELSADSTLRELYKNGHLGTAYIWTKVLLGEYSDCHKVIQIDSDVIFRQECISDIKKGFDDGYDLIGQRRPYEKNPCNRSDLKGLTDVVGTCFVGVNVDKISKYDFNTLHRMVVGYYNPLGHPILDFFDPVSFDILKNGGKILYLPVEEYGSMNENGSKDNSFGNLNTIMDFGAKIAHFGGIGSGDSFHHNGNGNVPASYAEWAKKRYYLYMKLMHGKDIGEYDQAAYESLKSYGL